MTTNYLEKEKKDVMEEFLNKVVQNYLRFNDHSEDDLPQAIKSFSVHLINVYSVHLVHSWFGYVLFSIFNSTTLLPVRI